MISKMKKLSLVLLKSDEEAVLNDLEETVLKRFCLLKTK